MKKIFQIGDKKHYKKEISPSDTATFHDIEIHPICATFVLAREIEWATRLFVLDMLDVDEEGMGTKLIINHLSPARVGEEIEIEAWVISLEKNELICAYEVKVGDRLIANGETGQKIFKKERIKQILG